MTALRRRIDGAYPITWEQFYSMFPQCQTMVLVDAAALSSKGFDKVHETPRPSHTSLDRVKEVAPVFNDELRRWEQAWLVEDISSSLDQSYVNKVIAEAKVKALSDLSNVSRAKQTGGFTWQSNLVLTDDQTCHDVLWAMQSFSLDPEQKMLWPTPLGGWIVIDNKFMTAMFRLIDKHKKACRAVESKAFARIQELRHPTDMQNVIASITWPE